MSKTDCHARSLCEAILTELGVCPDVTNFNPFPPESILPFIVQGMTLVKSLFTCSVHAHLPYHSVRGPGQIKIVLSQKFQE